jgi:hypothetical protein
MQVSHIAHPASLFVDACLAGTVVHSHSIDTQGGGCSIGQLTALLIGYRRESIGQTALYASQHYMLPTVTLLCHYINVPPHMSTPWQYPGRSVLFLVCVVPSYFRLHLVRYISFDASTPAAARVLADPYCGPQTSSYI